MTEQQQDSHLIDQYIRNQLSTVEEAEFEVRMLESRELRSQFEVAFAIRESLRLHQTLGAATETPGEEN